MQRKAVCAGIAEFGMELHGGNRVVAVVLPPIRNRFCREERPHPRAAGGHEVRISDLYADGWKSAGIGHSHRLLVAAPDYLARRGTPTTPQQLASHEGIRMPNVAGSEMLILYAPDGTRHQMPFTGRFRANHGLAVREAVVRGRGIAAAHHWLVDDLIKTGRLTPLLPGYTPPSVPLNMLIVPERAGIARVRLLIDDLVTQIARLPGILSTTA